MLFKNLPLLLLAAAPAMLWSHGDHGAHSETFDEQMAEFAPTLGEVTIEIEGEYRVIKSRDLPNHETGQFPGRDNPHAISAQSFQFKVPLKPQRAEKPMRYDGYEFGVAINGVPFDPNTGEIWQGQRYWRKEAILDDGDKQLGLDQNNAHVQPSGKYHYHGVPWGLIEELRQHDPQVGVDEPLLIGWAADGYPIYYQEGMRSSWQLKEGRRDGSPDGPGGEYDGQYTVDYEYAPESGDLDWLNGRYGATAEYPDGIYQYYLTENFPFAPRYFYGVPDESFAKQRGGMEADMEADKCARAVAMGRKDIARRRTGTGCRFKSKLNEKL